MITGCAPLADLKNGMCNKTMNLIFRPADILLPQNVDMNRWSVIACDQFTSDAAYWAAVKAAVGDAPSTLHLMLPEFYLGKCDEATAAAEIQQTMRRYLDDGVFKTVEQSFVYVERTLPGGSVRRGLIGMMDLEAYDYSADATTLIRATEGTVEDRLPPRVQVRRAAPVEMPHIMVFLNDPDDGVMRQAAQAADVVLYDFDLLAGGGHVRGQRVHGAAADALAVQISAGDAAVKLAIGDGNHSLAAARKCWLEKKQQLTPEQAASDPARFALVELVNIHDPAVTFAPIHRILFGTEPTAWFAAAEQQLCTDGEGRDIVLLAEGWQKTIHAKGASIGEVIGNAEQFCQAYLAAHGGQIDYIHGDTETLELAQGNGCCGILLPQMEKRELFSSVERSGPFPKKSFSIGLGRDKRYYLECRKIQ